MKSYNLEIIGFKCYDIFKSLPPDQYNAQAERYAATGLHGICGMDFGLRKVFNVCHVFFSIGYHYPHTATISIYDGQTNFQENVMELSEDLLALL